MDFVSGGIVFYWTGSGTSLFEKATKKENPSPIRPAGYQWARLAATSQYVQWRQSRSQADDQTRTKKEPQTQYQKSLPKRYR